MVAASGGYTAEDAAKLLEVSVGQVRSFVRAGLVDAPRGARGEYRFSFQDLVLLRAAKDLVAARIPRPRIRRALTHLQDSLPRGRSLSEMQIGAEGDSVVVHDGSKRWSPESGQLHFNFDVGELARRAAPLANRRIREAVDDAGMTADEWFEMAIDLEAPSPLQARAAYLRALDLDPDHAPTHVNFGRMLHDLGDVAGAEEHYRRAHELRSDDATAAYNLGVVLEDQGRLQEALAAYEHAIEADPGHSDAHFNAAGVSERLGRQLDALRHLKAYRGLTRG